MSLLSEVMTPFRGLGGSCRRVARKIRSRDLPAGFGVIIKGVAGLIAKGVRAGWAASGPKPRPAGKPVTGGEKVPDPSKIKKEKAAGEKPTPKGPSAADRAEAAGVMVLCTVIGLATLGTALATLGPRLAPYLPAAGAAAVPAVLIAAWIVAPQKPSKKPPAEPPTTTVEPPADTLLDTPEGRRFAFIRWLEKETRGTAGMHLDQMHHRLTQQEPAAAFPRHHLRTLLDHYQIPVQRTLRVGPVAGRTGVSRQAIEAAFSAATVPPPPGMESGRAVGAESDPDVQVSTDSTAVLQPVEQSMAGGA